jgi:hypothetical protein
MKIRLILSLMLLATSVLTTQAQTLYDNFGHKFINPSRWGCGICDSGNGREVECVREVENGQLHLVHRSFGLTDSNEYVELSAGISTIPDLLDVMENKEKEHFAGWHSRRSETFESAASASSAIPAGQPTHCVYTAAPVHNIGS